MATETAESHVESEDDVAVATNRALETAARWADSAGRHPRDRSAQLLADALTDPEGLSFTVRFIDEVMRPEDPTVAASHLAELTATSPGFLPAWLRLPARLGGATAKVAPKTVVAAARRVFRELVGDLVVDVSEDHLGAAIERLRVDGSRLNINLLGEAVLGDAEADRRLAETVELLHRDDIDYVSLKVSAITGPHNPWSFDEVVDHAVERLAPLYADAALTWADGAEGTFLNLDMEEYHDLDLTIEVFTRLLDRPENRDLHAGIVLQAYLPDALPAMQRIQAWAQGRRASGGAPVKVRIVKGANLAMERVESQIHGWEQVTWESKRATDANYLRLVDWSMTPEHTEAVRLGIAGHNLFTLAFAWELAGLRGVREAIDVEMLAGMAGQQAAAVREEVGNLLLYVPVVRPEEYDVAISYLARRLEENAAPDNFMASIPGLPATSDALALERDRFLAAVGQWRTEGDRRVGPNRLQDRRDEDDRTLERPVRSPGGAWAFANTPDSDPSLPANREWARGILERIPDSALGEDTASAARLDEAGVDEVLARGAAAGREWGSRSAAERAEVLHRVGVELGKRRGDLIEVAAAELGKGIDQSDVEVSEAIDFAHYYAERALDLETLTGARFTPVGLTLVTPPWNFPLSIPLGGVAAALAAGSAAILKPARIATRCGAVLAECLWAAGIPHEVAQLVVPADHAVGEALVRDPRVERVVLTGSSDTARMFRSWRPDLPLLAETSGKNSIIVTPSADPDLAVRDIVASAFGHAGQKCSAASLVILVGSAGYSRRLHDQLIDAVSSLVVDWPTNPEAQMGPLSEKPGKKLERGLTELEAGQHWELRPRQLDDSGRLWSPGVRSGVEPGSEFHLVEYFGPVLGIMRARTLEEAIDLQNGTEFGLTAGIQSLDRDEIKMWLDKVEAGNVYVNRGITGAIVRRQPFGGWKRSSVGAGAKAGGPNYLFGFGSFEAVEPAISEVGGPGFPVVPERAATVSKPQLRELLQASAGYLSQAERWALQRDVAAIEHACETEFDRLSDPTGVAAERNVLRYLPAAATIRAEEGTRLPDLVRVLAAAFGPGEFLDPTPEQGRTPGRRSAGGVADAGRVVTVSLADAVPIVVARLLGRLGAEVRVESHEEFVAHEHGVDHHRDGRIRLIGGSGDAGAALARELGGDVDVAIWAGPVTHCGRIEVLPFVHEQAVSMTNHRFGNPTPLFDDVLVEE